MALLDEIQHRVLAAGADMSELLIPLAHDSFPNQELRGVHMGQLIRCSAVLRYPSGVDAAVIAVLQNPANQRLDSICVYGLVERGRIIIPKGFIFRRERVAVVDGRTRLNTVRHLAIIGADSEGGKHIVSLHIPAVHELEVVTIPAIFVGLRVAGEGNHIDFRALPSGLGRSSKADEHGKAHEQGHDQRHAFPLYSRCHILSFSAHLGNKKAHRDSQCAWR